MSAQVHTIAFDCSLIELAVFGSRLAAGIGLALALGDIDAAGAAKL